MKQIKIIVICNDGVPDEQTLKRFIKKLDKFHKNNLLLFGNNIEVVVIEEETNLFKKLFKLFKR